MIQQVLDRGFLEAFLSDMKSETELTLKSPRRRTLQKTPFDEFSERQIRELQEQSGYDLYWRLYFALT